jgi:hypothetical protein
MPNILNYSFIDIVVVTIPYHWMRLAGGLMFLSGTLLMSYNLYKTYASSKHNLPVYLCLLVVMPYMGSHFLCPYAVIRQIDLAQFVQSHQLRRQSKCQILTVLNYFANIAISGMNCI